MHLGAALSTEFVLNQHQQVLYLVSYLAKNV